MNVRVKLAPRDSHALQEFVERVRASLGSQLVELKLFGSKARGQDVPDSDIDVLVVVRDDRVAAEDAILDIAFEVNLAHEVYISPRVIARAVLDDPVWKITPFFQAVEREGVLL